MPAASGHQVFRSTPDRRRRPVVEALVLAVVVVKLEIAADPRPRLRQRRIVLLIHLLVYIGERRHRLTKMLSIQRPRPSMLIAIWCPARSPLNFSLVNCETYRHPTGACRPAVQGCRAMTSGLDPPAKHNSASRAKVLTHPADKHLNWTEAVHIRLEEQDER